MKMKLARPAKAGCFSLFFNFFKKSAGFASFCFVYRYERGERPFMIMNWFSAYAMEMQKRFAN